MVDTLCASLGQGLLVWYAAEKQKAGASIEEVRDWCEANKLHICHWFTVNDLHYLKRGGRISAATAVVERPAAAPAPSVSADLVGDERAARIEEFLTGLLNHMGAQAAPKITLDEQGNYDVELLGQDLGSLIGRRGETLDAIQQLTGYAVNHGQSKRVRIHVDAEGYRAKREESLVRLAQKVAGKVVKYRRNVTLEPMNAYERHVIHTALQETPDITTYSIGTEPNRRTVVAYSRGEHR